MRVITRNKTSVQLIILVIFLLDLDGPILFGDIWIAVLVCIFRITHLKGKFIAGSIEG